MVVSIVLFKGLNLGTPFFLKKRVCRGLILVGLDNHWLKKGFLMKKIILVSAISMAMFSGVTMAAQSGQITFLGAVTQTTCDLSASANGAEKNQINLGVVSISATGSPVEFKLIKDPAVTCALTGKTATIAWMGNLSDKGVVNQSASPNGADGSWVKLTAKSTTSTSGDVEIKKGQDTVTFDAEKLNGNGFEFSAILNGGAVPGEFRSVTSYAVAYN
ncbi:hypothetical protein WN774_004587 [Salmonella enterica subsp. enterica serovar Bredeney]